MSTRTIVPINSAEYRVMGLISVGTDAGLSTFSISADNCFSSF
jgi:hypothetical protein